MNKELRIPLWDEGGHTILDYVTVRGRADEIREIENMLEYVRFTPRRGGEPREQTASEFLRRHKFWRG